LKVSEKVFSTIIIDVSKSSSAKMDSTLLQKDLESLKEVSEDSLTSSSEENNNESIFIKGVNKPQKNNKNNLYNPKNKNKIHCILKIYEEDQLIMSLDFYDNILIPNITFKGIPVPNELINPNQQKGKKELQAEELKNLMKTMTQYRIQCFIEGNEIPRYLQNENTIDWKIQIFSTETIGFIKDTTKEDHERSLINSWEIKESGRSLKAEHARIKFVEDRKFQVEAYLQENERGKKFKIIFKRKKNKQINLILIRK
jgi:hypothetical protein